MLNRWSDLANRSNRDNRSNRRSIAAIEGPSVLHRKCNGLDDDIAKMRIQLEQDPGCLERTHDAIGFLTPLQRAVIVCHSKCVEFLLAAGANPNASDRISPLDTLYFTLGKKDVQIAKLLLTNGAIPSNNTLISACRVNASVMVELLLSYGAMPEDKESLLAPDEFVTPATPLSVSTADGDFDCIKILVLYGAIVDLRKIPNISSRMVDQLSLPHILVFECATVNIDTKIKILRFFHEVGADIFYENAKGFTPLTMLQHFYRSLHFTLEEKEKMENEFEILKKEPLSLQSLARLKIKETMGSQYANKVKKLKSVPTQIIDLLLYSEF